MGGIKSYISLFTDDAKFIRIINIENDWKDMQIDLTLPRNEWTWSSMQKKWGKARVNLYNEITVEKMRFGSDNTG